MSTKLDLDFIPRHDFAMSKLNALGFLSLLAGLLISTYTYIDYQAKQKEYIELNQQLKNHQPNKKIASKVTTKELPNDELQQVKDTVEELVRPWSELLSGLEQIKINNVALLSVLPSVKKHQLIINGEAKNIESALTYIMALEELPMLSQVYLKKHSIDQTNTYKPVAFIIVAKWE
jgi:hypothetical protein